MDSNRPSCPKPDERLLRLRSDDCGAIMVMGIFMCLFLVGALWYIAGIGDAVIYRERMQEASDAVAFSTATFMARGMNMLVLLNLLMAAVEAIRVALNLIMFATLVLSAINLAIGAALDAASFGTAGTPFIYLGEQLFQFHEVQETQLHDQVSPRVDDALKALHNVEQGVWRMPNLAQGASLAIVDKYNPPIANDLVGAAAIFVGKGSSGTSLVGSSLPVTWGTTHKLCMKAFDAVKGVLHSIIGTDALIGPVEDIADAIGASDYFCELGDQGQPGDTSQIINDAGSAKCTADKNITTQCNTAAQDQGNVNTLAAKCPGWLDDPPPTTDPPFPECTSLPQMQMNAQAEQNQCDNMKSSCSQGVQNGASTVSSGNVQNPQTSQSASTNNQNQGSGNDKQPTKVSDDWWNGCAQGQILTVQYSEGKGVTYSPQFVAVASRGGVSMSDPSALKGQLTSASQAEFFYDCSGAWGDKGCNKDEDALWNFHWRARFRLVNANIFTAFSAPIYLPEGMMVKNILMQVAYDAQHPRWISIAPAAVQYAIDYENVTRPPMSMTLH
jgi:hypothetical protein